MARSVSCRGQGARKSHPQLLPRGRLLCDERIELLQALLRVLNMYYLQVSKVYR